MKFQPKEIQLKNGTKVTLRSVLPTEAGKMLAHLRITHTEAYKNMNQSADFWNNFTEQEEQKILAEFENSSSKFLLVALIDEKIIGGLGFVGNLAEFTRHRGQIGMSIQKAYSNCGLGTAMMRFTLEKARESGFHRVELSVRTYNEAGIALYEKMGFQRIGLLKDAAKIDGKFVDEYSYQLILD